MEAQRQGLGIGGWGLGEEDFSSHGVSCVAVSGIQDGVEKTAKNDNRELVFFWENW